MKLKGCQYPHGFIIFMVLIIFIIFRCVQVSIMLKLCIINSLIHGRLSCCFWVVFLACGTLLCQYSSHALHNVVFSMTGCHDCMYLFFHKFTIQVRKELKPSVALGEMEDQGFQIPFPDDMSTFHSDSRAYKGVPPLFCIAAALYKQQAHNRDGPCDKFHTILNVCSQQLNNEDHVKFIYIPESN